jgi:hypothetical protein
MGFTIELRDLPPDLLTQLDQRASEQGLDRQSFVVRLIEREVSSPKVAETFDSILEPLRRSVEESGMSEQEIEALVDEEVAAARRERRERSERV